MLIVYILGYVLIGLIVGKLWNNISLNHTYEQNLRLSKNRDKSASAEIKMIAYRNALDNSKLDRVLTYIFSSAGWPPILLAYIVYCGYMALSRIGNIDLGLGLSKAARDCKRAQADLAEEQRRLAAKKEEDKAWNTMVDFLNEQGINKLNYQKR